MYDLNHNHKYTGSLYLRITLFSLMNSGKTSCPSPLLLTQSQYFKDIYSRNCFSPHSMPAGSLSRSYYNSYNGNQHQHHHGRGILCYFPPGFIDLKWIITILNEIKRKAEGAFFVTSKSETLTITLVFKQRLLLSGVFSHVCRYA